jgi:hypothetical protein
LGSSVGDNLLIIPNSGRYEAFTSFKRMSGSSFKLWISKEGYVLDTVLRYYCKNWPGANDDCSSNAQILIAS